MIGLFLALAYALIATWVLMTFGYAAGMLMVLFAVPFGSVVVRRFM
jgi:hypothetical protein